VVNLDLNPCCGLRKVITLEISQVIDTSVAPPPLPFQCCQMAEILSKKLKRGWGKKLSKRIHGWIVGRILLKLVEKGPKKIFFWRSFFTAMTNNQRQSKNLIWFIIDPSDERCIDVFCEVGWTFSKISQTFFDVLAGSQFRDLATVRQFHGTVYGSRLSVC
jgi:hypothetical protein